MAWAVESVWPTVWFTKTVLSSAVSQDLPQSSLYHLAHATSHLATEFTSVRTSKGPSEKEERMRWHGLEGPWHCYQPHSQEPVGFCPPANAVKQCPRCGQMVFHPLRQGKRDGKKKKKKMPLIKKWKGKFFFLVEVKTICALEEINPGFIFFRGSKCVRWGQGQRKRES